MNQYRLALLCCHCLRNTEALFERYSKET